MNRHRISAWMAVALLFVPPIAAAAARQYAPHSQAQRMPNVQSATDYIYIDGFELPVDCTPVLTCPVPQSGKACISGRLTDAGSGAQLRALFKADLPCGGGAVGGPCDLALSAHDALQFVSNPGTSPPLASAETLLDGCGRFRFASIDPPGSRSVAIVADDADPAPASDLHVLTATPHVLGANQRIDGVNVVSAKRDTVNIWTQSAGSPFGASASRSRCAQTK